MSDQRVSVEISRTINLGNFESIRVQVGIEDTVISVKQNPSDVSDTFAYWYERLQIELDKAIKTTLDNINKDKPKSTFRRPISDEGE